MKKTILHDAKFEPIASAPTELALQSYVEEYKRSGYETEFRHEGGVVRLYVRIAA